MLMVNQLIGFGAIQANATITYETNDTSTGGTIVTYTGKAIGTASADRNVIVGVAASLGAGENISALTVGGISASLAHRVSPATNGIVDIWIAAVPTGTTADIVVTFSGAQVRGGIGVFSTTGLLSTTPTDTGGGTGDPSADTMNVSAGGVLVGVGFQFDDGTVTVTGLTGKYDVQTGAGGRSAGASDAFASAQTGLAVSFDWGAPYLLGAAAFAAFR